jgi:predicted enzyme related to lactoylglutathione lyase
MTAAMNTVIFPVSDLAVAKSVYGTLLGVEPSMDEPYYVGYDVGGQHLGLDPHGHDKGLTGPLAYWQVDDVGTSIKSLVDAGAEVTEAAHDVGGGKLVATVKDADGNLIGLMQAG